MTDTTELENVNLDNQLMLTGGVTVRQDLTLRDLAQTFVQSKMFPGCANQAQAVVKILTGHEMGLSPVESMRGIHAWEQQGTVAIELNYRTMAKLIKKSGKYNYKPVEMTDERCELAFFERETQSVAKRWQSCGPNITYTLEEAKRAGLASKNNWKNHPGDMCFARAMSRGMRRYCPDVDTAGPVYAEGEISDQPGARLAEAVEDGAQSLNEALEDSRPVETDITVEADPEPSQADIEEAVNQAAATETDDEEAPLFAEAMEQAAGMSKEMLIELILEYTKMAGGKTTKAKLENLDEQALAEVYAGAYIATQGQEGLGL